MIIERGVYDARHPLVVVEAGETGRAAVLAGIDCAQRNGGRLAVVYLLRLIVRLVSVGPVPFAAHCRLRGV